MIKSRQNIWSGAIVVLFSLSLFVSAHAETPSYYESNNFDKISVTEGKEPFVLKELPGVTISPGDVTNLEEIKTNLQKSQEKKSKMIVSSVKFLHEDRRYFRIVYFHENEPDVFLETDFLFAFRAFDDIFYLFPRDNGQAFSLPVPVSRMDDVIIRFLAPGA